MTPYEYMDISVSYAETGGNALMGYFTVLTAYFIVAYVVGASLNRSQVFAATGLFLIMELFMIWGTASYMYASRGYRILAEEWVPTVAPHHIAIPLLVLGVISGLKFMWDVRHPEPQ